MTQNINRPSPSELERMAETFDWRTLDIKEVKLLADCVRSRRGNYKEGVVLYFITKIEAGEQDGSEETNQ